ncbi:hypothetical protein CDL15_Pgr013090 [Punica granatum]|nr:hypothetical protein CDL15_Pgr013090 [Punica granatum]PKH48232.1 hypothetical protein CRG98_050364 [Punica granatum]
MASSYGKINEAEQARLDAGRKSRKRFITIALSSVVLVCVIVAAVVGTQVGNGSNKDGAGEDPKSPSTSVKAVCDLTLYKESCYNSMSHKVNPNQVVQPQKLFKLAIQVAMDELGKASDRLSSHLKPYNNNSAAVAALDSCHDLLALAIDHLNGSYASGNLDSSDDLRTWLSTAGTCQETCLDGFDELALGPLKDTVKSNLKISQELTSNSLAIITWISKIMGSIKLRRLMGVEYHDKTNNVPKWPHQNDRKLPNWLKPKDRKLIQSSADLRKIADAVVAKDGSGKYKTIKDALKDVPDKSDRRYVIYAKKGIYEENVRVEKPKWNVVMVGDGKDVTIVTGKLNVVDGTPTFQSATFAVFGKGFVARDMGFRNTAGPSKHQAVALMSTADHSAFYRCKFEAFQDTLYAHSNRQFYRECDVYGTVDFIFGNSAVVLQNCNILPRVPMKGQQNTITAQGRADPNQNTGISIHNCTLWPSGNLSSVRTFLGRPWKNYSTTAYVKTMMNSFIDPKGWLPWTGDSAPSTIYYSEYGNFGPGASTKGRVKWKGLRTNLSIKEAEKFTVKSFLGGEHWIKKADVSYKPGL